MRRILNVAVLASLVVAPVAAVAGAVAYDRAGLGTGVAPTTPVAAAHADPPPPGVDVRKQVSTDELYRKARLTRPERGTQGPQRSARALAATPPGAPSLPVLTSHVEPSCTGTGTDGNRVQVLYAYAAGTTGRFADVEALIRNEVATVDDVFAVSSDATGGGLRVRWVADASCRVSVLPVALPASALQGDFWATVAAVYDAGFRSANRKYLVFSEGRAFCGVGEMYTDNSRAENWNDGHARDETGKPVGMVSRVDQACWSNSSYHSTAAHELIHNVGGVQDSAPNSTLAGHCTDDSDLMCYADGGPNGTMREVCSADEEQLLDCRKDDYFHTSPRAGTYLATSWNTADSSFLDTVAPLRLPERTERAFAIRASGTTTVTVTGTLTGPGGAPVTGTPVTLRTRPYGTPTWRSTTGYRTDASGRVTYTLRPSSAAYVSFVYAGSPTQAAATSPSVLVRTPTRMTLASALGSTTTLTATLSNSVTGRGVAGQPVTLKMRRAGSSTWSTVTTGLRTDSSGRAAYRYRTSHVATFAFSHPGSSTTTASSSSTVLVRIPTKLTMSVKAGRPNVLTGRLTTWAGSAVRSAPVVVQYRYAGTSSWRSATTALKTSSTGYVSVRVQPRRATYYRLVYRGSTTTYLATTGAAGYVRY